MWPGKNNTTAYRNERQGIQDLRDVLQSRAAEIEGLQAGDLAKFEWTTPAPRLGYNSAYGAGVTDVTFVRVSITVVRMPGGRLHLMHFSPVLHL
jgi:hypothetical protein